MSSIQHTIRSVPTAVDQALRRRAKEEGRSLNAVAVEALQRGLDLLEQPVAHHDLDDLIGSWEDDPGFDAAILEFGRVDEEAWR